VPERYRHNLPRGAGRHAAPLGRGRLLPDFPFGTDLTDDELHIVRALKKLKHASQHPASWCRWRSSLWDGKEAPHAYLERLGLADAHSFKDLFMRRLFAGNL
jgi:hypothetical protein